jgi:Ni/Co efflux regulator RcnB
MNNDRTIYNENAILQMIALNDKEGEFLIEGARIPGTLPWYEVRDYDRYDLPAPPDGSRYVLIDNDLVRVAIATGIILEFLGRY